MRICHSRTKTSFFTDGSPSLWIDAILEVHAFGAQPHLEAGCPVTFRNSRKQLLPRRVTFADILLSAVSTGYSILRFLKGLSKSRLTSTRMVFRMNSSSRVLFPRNCAVFIRCWRPLGHYAHSLVRTVERVTEEFLAIFVLIFTFLAMTEDRATALWQQKLHRGIVRSTQILHRFSSIGEGLMYLPQENSAASHFHCLGSVLGVKAFSY